MAIINTDPSPTKTAQPGFPAFNAAIIRSTNDDTDRTADIQAVLDSDAGNIYLGPGEYVVSAQMLVRSNTNIQLHPEAVIKRSLSMPVLTRMFYLLNVSNILIEGGTVDGNKQSPSPGVGGQAIGVACAGATDILIRDMTIKDFPADIDGNSYGYGLYLGSGGTVINQRIHVENCVLSGHEQNCAMVTSARDLSFVGCTFYGTTGDDPGSGLNVEPNIAAERVQGLAVRDCVFEECNYGLTMNNHYLGDWHSASFERCTFRNNRAGGASITGGNLPELDLTISDCKFLNNRNGPGLFLGSVLGLRMSGCRFIGNKNFGIQGYELKGFVVRDSQFWNNYYPGIGLAYGFDFPVDGLIDGCSLFNNEEGIRVSRSSGASLLGLHLDSCITGNDDRYKFTAWAAGREYDPDTRVTNAGNIYQCITSGTSAASGGPTTTDSDITDNTVHWRFCFPCPTQTYGYKLDGTTARGVKLTRPENRGNTTGHLYETPSGAEATIYTADILGSAHTSDNKSSPVTRASSVLFEDLSATAGNVSTGYAAGIAAFDNGASTVVVSTPFANEGDGVLCFLQAADATLTRVVGKVTSDGQVTFTGNASATAETAFYWELRKKASSF